jgi:hypothetical protein
VDECDERLPLLCANIRDGSVWLSRAADALTRACTTSVDANEREHVDAALSDLCEQAQHDALMFTQSTYTTRADDTSIQHDHSSVLTAMQMVRHKFFMIF